ncbi:Importin subunit beta [Strongyloides ratti]|uniref:Importin subunit beta n=1 Tax=Strongyloides ratti TaxID=34506 RepID=A0A090LJ25_STRRB|nr:Importin subunit beta [Strongyloides ratti]CEF68143.1 Importin subunit beta [Strongyloides ratti]
MNQLLETLEKTISNNPADQKLALEFLNQASEQNFAVYILELSKVLKHTGHPNHVRQAAGIQLKNCLVAKEEETKLHYASRWLTLPENIRLEVRTNVVETIGTEQFRPSAASQCVAAIAGIEIPRNMWPDAIKVLSDCVSNLNANALAKEVSLEALGYICQDLDSTVLEANSNTILTAIVYGMRRDETNVNIKRAAVKALLNSLEFTRNNFSIEEQRNHIMTIICDATQDVDKQVKVCALECLVKVMSLYYSVMQPYMAPALFPISIAAMKSDIDDFKLQGIEFWSNVAENEIAFICEAEEAKESGIQPTQFSQYYAKGALQYICPIILNVLVKVDEDDDDDEWTPSKSAGVCLQLLAQCTGDDICQYVLPFITENFKHQDWRYREAAVMAFGCIMEGPDKAKLNELISHALGSLIETLGDSHIAVRDSAAWTLGKACELSMEIVTKPDVLQLLLPALSNSLLQEPRVAANICWTISSLARAAYEVASLESGAEEPETFVLSSCFEAMVEELLKTTDRPDGNISNLRIAAYETLMEMIKNSPKDCYSSVQKTTLNVLHKMEQLLQLEDSIESSTDKSQLRNLQSLLCATLQSVIKKIRPEDTPLISDTIMNCVLQIMQRCQGKDVGGVMEDALLTVSALVESLGRGFSKYVTAFKPFLLLSLKNYKEGVVFIAALGVLTDLCREFEKDICFMLDECYQILIEVLHAGDSDKYLKADILACFGDIALAISDDFKRYFQMSMELLCSASKAAKIGNYSDYEQIEYVEHLRSSCVTALSSICQAYPVTNELKTYVFSIVELIVSIGSEEDIPDTLLGHSCGLLGDIIKLFGADLLPLLNNTILDDLLNRGRRSNKAKSTAIYATKELRKIKPVS